MPCILSIETSTKVCSVALSIDGQIFYNRENKDGASHASLLGVFISEAVNFAMNQKVLPDAVAVSSGPGSYTGLRIGVSEAKGLCFGWDIPLISIPSLKIMASSVIDSGNIADFYCPMIDARRMEVYATIYDKQLNIIRGTSADIVVEDAYQVYLEQGKVLFFGDGCAKCMNVINSPHAQFLDGVNPLASSMVSLAEEAFRNQIFEDVAYFEPFYLKEFMATVPKNKVIGVGGR